jgi:hypothetical protein
VPATDRQGANIQQSEFSNQQFSRRTLSLPATSSTRDPDSS